MRTASWYALASLLLLMAGCQKLKDERTVQLAPGEDKTLTIDAPKKDQKVSVEVSSPGVAVSAYVFLEKDSEAAQKDIDAGKNSDKVLAKTLKTEQGTMEAAIPGGNKFIVLLSPAATKTATVKVTITGS